MKTLSMHILYGLIGILFILTSCGKPSEDEQMIRFLASLNQQSDTHINFFSPEAKIRYYDSLLTTARDEQELFTYQYLKAYFHLQTGEPELAISIYKNLLDKLDDDKTEARKLVNLYLGVSYMRLGEQMNCVDNLTSESCILPFAGVGIHQKQSGSANAIAHFEAVLQENTNDLETRWLLNVAYMSLGRYPDDVPEEYLITGLDQPEEDTAIKPFSERSSALSITSRDMSGGIIVEDFTGDGYLDIVTSAWGLDEPMHFWINNGDGSFTDASQASNLERFTGGLNIMQTDYNNDGWPDIFVLRGGWMQHYGKQPNSLLRNNGNGTFSDVTQSSGLLSFIPAQTATWNDFNNDGWLDVFIGNESFSTNTIFPTELYINQGDGTFKNMAAQSDAYMIDYVKAVTSGDYDNDGWPDIYVSTMSGRNHLLKNLGETGMNVKFRDVTNEAGLGNDYSKTFPTWFWDFDNDGWLDIFVSGYEFEKSLGYYEAAEKLGLPLRDQSKMKLYRNNGDGTFTNIAEQSGLNRVINAMGCNFGDINNDGYLDFYMGTGNPDTKSIIPNRLFLNEGGERFIDVSASARVGHLQKGHGISFADLDGNGFQDILLQVGGSFKGESFQNAIFMNPGKGDNNWITIKTEGVTANRSGIGSRLKITFTDEGVQRSVYREINSGASFGASPLQAHIGIGQAQLIDEIEIIWSGSRSRQTFKQVLPNRTIRIKEGEAQYEIIQQKIPVLVPVIHSTE